MASVDNSDAPVRESFSFVARWIHQHNVPDHVVAILNDSARYHRGGKVTCSCLLRAILKSGLVDSPGESASGAIVKSLSAERATTLSEERFNPNVGLDTMESLTLSHNLVRVLQATSDIAGIGPIHGRYLVAALISTTVTRGNSAISILKKEKKYLAARHALLDWVNEYSRTNYETVKSLLGPDPAGEVDAEPTQPPTLTVPRFINDYVDGELVDKLGYEREANALAKVIASRQISPPLSIGLFGDWGSGKSFFMKLLERNIKIYSSIPPDQGGDFMCNNVVHITFNAWHYMDTVLWSSLVTRVFEKLSEFYCVKDNGAQMQEALVRDLEQAKLELNETQARRESAESARATAEKRLRYLEEQVKARNSELLDLTAGDIGKVILNNPEISKKLGEVKKELKIGEIEDFGKMVSETNSEAKSVAAKLKTLWFLIRKNPRIAVFMVLVLAAPAAILYLTSHYQIPGGLITSILTAIATIGGFLKTQWPKLKAGTDKLLDVYGKLEQAQRDKSTSLTQESSSLKKEIESLESQRKLVEDELDAQKKRIAEIDQQLCELNSGKQLSNFILSRSESEDYRRHAGIIAHVHQDFKRLSELMIEAAKSKGSDKAKDYEAVERIVLYIDDLDRCPASRVIEVLQAVHLMLAFPLFVVVVGIDPAWMQSALNKYYRDQMGIDNKESGLLEYAPQRYLEKIFQVPFALSRMEPDESADLMKDLIAPKAATPAQEVVSGGVAVVEETRVAPGEDPEGEEDEEEEQTESVTVSVEEMKLSEAEQALMVKLAGLATTPRAMKRLVNTYHILRELERGPDPASDPFLQKEYEYAIVALFILICCPEGGKVCDRIAGPPQVGLPETLMDLSSSSTGQTRDFLEKLDSIVGLAYFVDPLRKWACDVKRFSFEGKAHGKGA